MQMDLVREIRVGYMACGSGFGAHGFRKGDARVGNLRAKFRNIGGIDNDPAAIRDFERFAGVKGTLLDLMSLEQYRDFHGHEPPPGWQEITIADVHRAMGYERPHIWFTSSPCKGFSGLLSERLSLSPKYQALNGLALRSIWLALEAYKDDPAEFFLFENVPRIATRGRGLIDQIIALLEAYDYAVAETVYDCGELGGLAQTRKRYLLAARHRKKVPPYLYQPSKRRLRGVGEVLDLLPLPGDERAGPMHRMPALQWKTWVRLAFVEAGSDWRSLNRLRVENGHLADFGIFPDRSWRDGTLGVLPWDASSGTVTAQAEATTGRFSVADPRTSSSWEGAGFLGVKAWGNPSVAISGNGRPGAGAFSIADPRVNGHAKSVQLGVRRWEDPAPVVKGDVSVGTGPYAICDPRIPGPPRFNNVFRIVPWNSTAPAVAGPGGPAGGLAVADPRTGGTEATHTNKFSVGGWDEPASAVIGTNRGPGSGAGCVADPRAAAGFGGGGKYRVTHYEEPAGSVIGASTTGQGAFAVADPRPTGLQSETRSAHSYNSQGHYGVMGWADTSVAVPGYAKYDRGKWSVADPRTPLQDAGADECPVALPQPNDRLVAVIHAQDGTWHRPFTTLELAALQSLFDPEEWQSFEMDGKSDSAWRERIGNAVPPAAAQTLAGVFGRTLLLAWSGETFLLSSDPIWVQPLTIALSVDTPELAS